jgi:multisubunit Na+/H+ antiporter MnhB subunit
MVTSTIFYTLAQISNPFPEVPANQNVVTLILNIVFGIVGSLSLLFIVIGGFRYVISGGDPQNTARAKNTIIYAVVGLAVTLLAAAIVNFVVGNL